jgi:hypothetical protein
MKQIFVFDDSRVTDRDYHILALSEDGQGIALIKFDDWTLPHVRFAMCVDENSDVSGALIGTVSDTRAEVYAAYNIFFGSGNWRAVWVNEPKQDPMCLDAMRSMHAKLTAEIEKRNTELVETLFGALGETHEQPAHATH